MTPDPLVPPTSGEDRREAFRDAENWLTERGVDRQAIGMVAPRQAIGMVAPRHRRSRQTASRTLEQEVAKAVAHALRLTAQAPKSEARLKAALHRRGFPDPVVEAAMVRCRAQGIVDDRAYAAALVQEGRRKGHAPLRLRTDLEARGFDANTVAQALAAISDRDLEAAAFAVAVDRAARLRGVEQEVAFRRVVAYLARRGHPESLARRVARQAVFNDREPQRRAKR